MVTPHDSDSQPTLDVTAAASWLNQLHGDSQGLIHVCASDNWSGQACETVEEAAAYIKTMDLGGKSGIYVRVSTLRGKLSPGTRGKASDTACVPAMWADIDIAGPGHKSPHRLPATEDDARNIITKSGLPEPTLWVHSGGGLYPWWMLVEPYCTPTEDDQERAAFLARAWQDIIAHSAYQLGWYYGTEVSDLARVTRIVGTVNRKVPDQPKLAQIVEGGSGVLYHFDDLMQVAVECKLAIPAPEPVNLPVPIRQPGEGLRPGDDFNVREPWDSQDLLHDWQVHHKVGSTVYWTRPGKSLREGYSATTGRDPEQDRLYVFSSSTLLPMEQPLTKFAVYSLLRHGGDYAAAAGELRRKGYGDPLPPRAVATVPGPEPVEGRVIGPDDPPVPGETGREALNVGNAAVMADWFRDNLGRGKLSGIFMRSGEMVHCPRIGEEGYVRIGGSSDEDGPAQIRLVTPGYLVGKVQYLYDCYKQGRDGNSTPSVVPAAAASIPVAVPEMLPHLRVLSAVTHTPFVRPDGSVVYQPGYDEATRTLFLPEPGLDVPMVADNPTAQDAIEAMGLIRSLVAEFPFTSEHDFANFTGMLLTPLLRRITAPPYQMFAITAPMPGSGKTLLASVCRTIHGGVFRAEMPENAAELRKQISSILDTTTGPVIHIDNVTGILSSSVLAGLLTTTRWDDRRLGTADYLSVPNDRIWVVTGNNVSIGGDLPRRTVSIRIDANDEHPWLRTDFTIKDLEGLVQRERGRLLWALLTMIRSWVINGAVVPTLDRADSYGTWHQVVRGVLTHAGVTGTFAHQETQPENAGSDDTDWGEFLETVYRLMQDRPWTVAELLAHAGYHAQASLPIDALPGDLADKFFKANGRVSAVSRSLGRWLNNRQGKWVNGLAAREAGIDRHAVKKKWRVQVHPRRQEVEQ